MSSQQPDPDAVALLQELAGRIAERGRPALDLWQFTAALVRVARERRDYIDAMPAAEQQRFHDATTAALRDYVAPSVH
jgi:hypothetical protein